MTAIFISYRREDSEGYTRAIYNALVESFDPKQIFMDVDDIAGGVDFEQAIEGALGGCDVALVVIGEEWLSCTDERGRRLDQEEDFVRLEVAAALGRSGVQVIPVLVGGAEMPRQTDLPEPLRELTKRNAVAIDHRSFEEDARRLEEEIRKAVRLPSRKKVFWMRATGFGAVALAAVIAFTVWVSQRVSPPTDPELVQAVVEQVMVAQEPYWKASVVSDDGSQLRAIITEVVQELAAKQDSPESASALQAAREGQLAPASALLERRMAEAENSERQSRSARQYLTLSLPSLARTAATEPLPVAEEAVVQAEEAARRLSSREPAERTLLVQVAYLHKDLAQRQQRGGSFEASSRHLRRAQELFEAVLQVDDRNASAANGIASVLATEGDYAAALPWAKRAVELMPNYLYAWHDLGLIQYHLAREARARGEADRTRAAIRGFREARSGFQRQATNASVADSLQLANNLHRMEQQVASWEREL